MMLSRRLLQVLFLTIVTLGLTTPVFAQDSVAILKLAAEGGDEDALTSALKSTIRDAGVTLAPKGGDVTLEDVQLVTECEDASPECLDMVADFLSASSVIYGEIAENGEAKVSWYVKGEGFKRAVSGAANNADDAKTLAGRLVVGETGILVVSSGDEVGAEVVVDGQPIGITPLNQRVPEGSHSIVVRKAGFLDSESRKVEVRRDQESKLDFSLEQDPNAMTSRGTSTMSIIGWVVTGVGGAAMIGATITGVMTISAEDEVDKLVQEEKYADAVDKADSGKTLATTTNILWGVGGGLLATGITLVILGYVMDDGPSDESAAWNLNIGPLPEGGAAAGFSVAW